MNNRSVKYFVSFVFMSMLLCLGFHHKTDLILKAENQKGISTYEKNPSSLPKL